MSQSTMSRKPRVVRILYIDPQADEKRSSPNLEKITESLEFVSVFTVVTNPYTGLECTEHTIYDAIFITNDSKTNLSPYDFIKILRAVGNKIPVVLMVGKYEPIPSYGVMSFTEPHLTFAAVMIHPFTEQNLREIIVKLIEEPVTVKEEDRNEEFVRGRSVSDVGLGFTPSPFSSPKAGRHTLNIVSPPFHAQGSTPSSPLARHNLFMDFAGVGDNLIVIDSNVTGADEPSYAKQTSTHTPTNSPTVRLPAISRANAFNYGWRRGHSYSADHIRSAEESTAGSASSGCGSGCGSSASSSCSTTTVSSEYKSNEYKRFKK